ncbi:MAG: hypothetical protein ACRC10_01400 [Thermoguttaceae bacterium]
MMTMRIFNLILFLVLVLTVSVHAEEPVPSTPETRTAQELTAPQAGQPVHAQVVVSEITPHEKTGSFFSWSWFWFFLCLIVATGGFIAGKVHGKQEGDFSALLLANVITSLPDNLEIEYEISKLSASRVRLSIRVLVKEPNGSGRLTTTEVALGWDDLPDEIRADFIRSGNRNHVRSLKKGPSQKPQV